MDGRVSKRLVPKLSERASCKVDGVAKGFSLALRVEPPLG